MGLGTDGMEAAMEKQKEQKQRGVLRRPLAWLLGIHYLSRAERFICISRKKDKELSIILFVFVWSTVQGKLENDIFPIRIKARVIFGRFKSAVKSLKK